MCKILHLASATHRTVIFLRWESVSLCLIARVFLTLKSFGLCLFPLKNFLARSLLFWLYIVKTRAMPLRTWIIFASFDDADPVTLDTRSWESSFFKSSSCFFNSSGFFCRSSCAVMPTWIKHTTNTLTSRYARSYKNKPTILACACPHREKMLEQWWPTCETQFFYLRQPCLTGAERFTMPPSCVRPQDK